jgi:hypothetical protein
MCQGGQRKIGHQQFVARKPMQKPPLDPDVADTAPSNSVLTVYDEEHIITYLRLKMHKSLEIFHCGLCCRRVGNGFPRSGAFSIF